MKVRGLMRLIAALSVVVAGTWGMAAEEDEPPRLKDKVVLNTRDIVSRDILAFSPDGKKLLTFGRGEGRARLWDLASEKNIACFKHRRNVVSAVAFSPDGKFIATAGHDGEIWVQDVENGKKITSFAGDISITRIIYGSDGKTLCAVTRGELRIYDVKEGRLLRSRQIHPSPGFDAIRPVTPSRAMKRPMIGCGSHLYDAVTGELCYRITGGKVFGSVTCAAITADERKIATGGTGPIEICDTKAENQESKYLALKHPNVEIHCLAFTPNEKILAAGFEYNPPLPGMNNGRGGVLLFDVSSGKLLDNHDARIAAVYSLAFSPDGRLLATGDHDLNIKLWDVPAAWRKKDK